MTHLALVVGWLAWASGTPLDASPDPKSLIVSKAEQEKARALVRSLASPRFQRRDEAARELRTMGRLALAALTAALNDPDAEVRFRAQNLLPAARADEFEARLNVFLADTDGKHKHDLPGWAKFRKLTGNDPLARELFAELLKSEPNRVLIAGIDHDKAELERRVLARRYDLYARMYQRVVLPNGTRPPRYEPTLVDAAGLLFAESLIDDKTTPRGAIRMATPYTVLSRGNLRSALAKDRLGPVVSKLLVAWMDSRDTATSLVQAMNLAGQHQPELIGKYAAKLIEAEGTSAYQRASAATTVARHGSKTDLAALVPLLADDAILRAKVANNNEIQVRDVALAMAALLTERDPADFGMDSRRPGTPQYSYVNYTFPDDKSRTEALAKWAKLEPKHTPKK